MAASNFLPVQGINRLIRGFADTKKINVSTHPRSFPTGSFLWLNKVSGRYQAEPALLSPTNATTDSTAANSSASTYSTAAAFQAAVAPLFLGIAAEARIPAQLNTLGAFGVASNGSGVPVPGIYPMDASKPFISYWDSGIAVMPVGPSLLTSGAITTAIDPGTKVTIDTFVNEETYGFYDPAGAQQIGDTDYYGYNAGVTTTATAANAIGVVVERAEVGQNFVVVKFEAYPFQLSGIVG